MRYADFLGHFFGKKTSFFTYRATVNLARAVAQMVWKSSFWWWKISDKKFLILKLIGYKFLCIKICVNSWQRIKLKLKLIISLLFKVFQVF